MAVKNDLIQKDKSNAPYVLPEHSVYIVWKPEYDLGIPVIDEQHRGIVTIINSLHYCMHNSHIKNILPPTIDMLRSYADIHFQTEEYFLSTIEYPGDAKHRLLHKEYTFKLAGIERDIIINKDPGQLIGFLKKWWLGHICEEDMQFKNYFT